MTQAEVKEVQRALNAFTDKRLRGVSPLIVDGDKGPATNKRISLCKWYLGLKAPTGSGVGKRLLIRLREPKHPEHFPSKAFVERGIKRRKAQRRRYRREKRHPEPGVTRYDDVPVAEVAVPYLRFARNHGWQGQLVSGWRDPEYSESLCRRMCGMPSCPGTCAGKASNHSGKTKDKFALDVSDWARFTELMARSDAPKPRIFNDLPRDRVHLSPNGH
jgi:hypothetical protein